MKRCKQCGYELIPTQNPYEKTAQDAGFCCRGCWDVHEAIKEMELNGERLRIARGL